MNLNEVDIEKTALLFFDMLNGFYHEAGDDKKARMKPMIDNAVRLMKGGRQADMPIFFAKGNHRPDGMTASSVLTDTDNTLKPWPNGVIERGLPVAVSHRLLCPQKSLERFLSDLFGSSPTHKRY